jgi:hypothetical protein
MTASSVDSQAIVTGDNGKARSTPADSGLTHEGGFAKHEIVKDLGLVCNAWNGPNCRHERRARETDWE